MLLFIGRVFMKTEKIKELILKALPGADVEIIDTKGTGDHFSARVSSQLFEGKSLIAQHRMVMGAVNEYIKGSNAPIHALDIKTKVK